VGNIECQYFRPSGFRNIYFCKDVYTFFFENFLNFFCNYIGFALVEQVYVENA